MNIQYPHTIENCLGEKIIFQSVQKESEGERVILENFVQPGQGPIMHTHFLQEEGMTVIKGKLGYQLWGEEAQYAGEGESVSFKRGTPHKFWNAGEGVLNCKGWIMPAHNVVYFLTALYQAQNKSGKSQPETFDGAYLVTRYASEFDIPEVPGFVKKVIMPATVLIGKILGKYKHFRDAPKPVK